MNASCNRPAGMDFRPLFSTTRRTPADGSAAFTPLQPSPNQMVNEPLFSARTRKRPEGRAPGKTVVCALFLIALIVLLALPAAAQNPASAIAGLDGPQLAQRILAQRPATGFTNRGVMKLHDPDRGNTNLPLTFRTVLAGHDWSVIYQAGDTTLTVTHPETGPNRYSLQTGPAPAKPLTAADITIPFAGSDFLVSDLGLEFFHWPGQKILKKEFHRNCSCVVLESSQPHPAKNGYTRIDAWIDEESLGIVDAVAYDAAGNELKNFYPKDLTKVDGQYQVQTMVMKNVQTDSKTTLEFNYDEPEKNGGK